MSQPCVTAVGLGHLAVEDGAADTESLRYAGDRLLGVGEEFSRLCDLFIRHPSWRDERDGVFFLGCVHVVQGTTAHPTQALFLTDTEAADWAAAAAAGKI
ncbi:hypothetical protein [Streptomyces sp. NPDC002853]